MAAPFLPPPNLAGISPPPPPQNPVVYADIAPALDYVCQLNDRHQMGKTSDANISVHIVTEFCIRFCDGR